MAKRIMAVKVLIPGRAFPSSIADFLPPRLSMPFVGCSMLDKLTWEVAAGPVIVMQLRWRQPRSFPMEQSLFCGDQSSYRPISRESLSITTSPSYVHYLISLTTISDLSPPRIRLRRTSIAPFNSYTLKDIFKALNHPSSSVLRNGSLGWRRQSEREQYSPPCTHQ